MFAIAKNAVAPDAAVPALKTKLCTYPGCDRPFRATGLCVKHYSQAKRQRDKIPAGYIDPDDFWEWVKKELDIQ